LLFLVEPESGQRCHYACARALGVAIWRGALGPQGIILHQKSRPWVPISVHPEYRRAESDVEEGSARELRARRWTFLSEPAAENDPPVANAAAPDYPGAVPLMVPGEGETSWLGSAVRHLLHLGRSGV
jgi:hypothetical protein